MQIHAIVYTSNTGHTAAYANMLGKATGLPVYPLADLGGRIPPNAPVLYMGWLMANTVAGYKKTAKRCRIVAVCGVGLSPTGATVNDVRTANAFPADLPVFTLQGGMDITKLRGIYRFMIRMLTKSLAAKTNRTPEENGQLELLRTGGNFVSVENLTHVLKWIQE